MLLELLVGGVEDTLEPLVLVGVYADYGGLYLLYLFEVRVEHLAYGSLIGVWVELLHLHLLTLSVEGE